MQNTRSSRYDESARKLGVFSITIFATVILAGAYGILHDQFTFWLSPEYFTKFKFQQFGYEPTMSDEDLKTVAIIGFLATWWMGLIIGFLIGCFGFIYTYYENMKTGITVAVVIVLATSVFFALLGYLWGKFYLVNKGVSWWIPDDLIDRDNFIIVGSIHNFSYIGGGVGLVLAIIYMVRYKNILVRKG